MVQSLSSSAFIDDLLLLQRLEMKACGFSYLGPHLNDWVDFSWADPLPSRMLQTCVRGSVGDAMDRIAAFPGNGFDHQILALVKKIQEKYGDECYSSERAKAIYNQRNGRPNVRRDPATEWSFYRNHPMLQ